MAQVFRVQDSPTSYIQLDTPSVMSLLDLLGFPKQVCSDVTSRVARSSVFNRRVPHFLELCCDSDHQSAHFPVQNVRWKVTTEVCYANECSPQSAFPLDPKKPFFQQQESPRKPPRVRKQFDPRTRLLFCVVHRIFISWSFVVQRSVLIAFSKTLSSVRVDKPLMAMQQRDRLIITAITNGKIPLNYPKDSRPQG